MTRRGGWAVLGTLGALLAIVIPELGSDPWPFHPPAVHPRGVFGPFVRAAGRHWDHGFIRTPATIAALLVAAAAVVAWQRGPLRASVLGALAVVVVLAVLVPAVVLQTGLRQA